MLRAGRLGRSRRRAGSARLPAATTTVATSCSLTLVRWEISRKVVNASSALQPRISVNMPLVCSMTGWVSSASLGWSRSSATAFELSSIPVR